jgi:hypothetical protein
MVANPHPFSSNFSFGNRKKSQDAKSREYGGWVGDDRNYVFFKKYLTENVSVRRGVVMVKQPRVFSPNFGATSSHVFTQLPKTSQ